MITRRTKIVACAAVLLAPHGVVAQTAKYTPQQIEDALAAAYSIDAIQPPQALIERIERSVSDGQDDVNPVTFFPVEALPQQSTNALLFNGLPYFNYYSQKNSEQYIIHPMRTGRFLVDNAAGSSAPELIEALLDVAFELPNGALAWYYPRHYDVARMMGPHLKYSAISQGTLIAGLHAVADQHPEVDDTLAQRAFQAMLWPFEKGGVNLADRAVLEMPAFAGPPEIILNGWIDALIHIRDYADETGDPQALELFRRNVEFMGEILPNFDAPGQHISRYSDLSPYRVKVTVAAPDDVDSLRLLYIPKSEALEPILIDLERTEDPEDFSIYENQIFRQNGRNAFVWLSCSQLYDTVLISDSPSMSIEMNSGTVARKSSAPGHGGDPVEVATASLPRGSYAVIGTDDGLTCGYPTNFAKGGVENFYHAYHVVSLMMLATGGHVPAKEQAIMSEWAFKWLSDMEIIRETEGLEFRDPQLMLDAINAGKLTPSYGTFDDLQDAARLLVVNGARSASRMTGR